MNSNEQVLHYERKMQQLNAYLRQVERYRKLRGEHV